jgi:hypothetical protein
LYGGLAGDFATSAQATSPHVLSLPSFFWQRRDVGADYSRDGHSCNVVGNKQMAIIGGTVSSAQQYAIADPWTNGIGIFDLSDMEWKDSYNANAGPYVTPEFVKAHNNQNPYPDKWSDPVVESWFTQKGAHTFHFTIEYCLLIELKLANSTAKSVRFIVFHQ